MVGERVDFKFGAPVYHAPAYGWQTILERGMVMSHDQF